MERRALDILGQAVVFGENSGTCFAHYARDRRGPGQALGLHQQFQRTVATATGGNFEHAGLSAIGIDDGAHIETLKQTAPGDVLRQLLDRHAGLDAPDVRLAEDQLVEGNVTRGRQVDFLNGGSHRGSLRDERREPLSRPQTRHENPVTPLPFSFGPGAEIRGRSRDGSRLG